MYITAQGCRLRNDLYCVEWGIKLYYTIPNYVSLEWSVAQNSELLKKQTIFSQLQPVRV